VKKRNTKTKQVGRWTRKRFRNDIFLTNRQNEICELVKEGLSNREIGKKLRLTEKTIKFHLTRAFAHPGFIKKKISTRTRLMKFMCDCEKG